MPYSVFKFSDLRQKFGIVEETSKLFENIKTVQPSDWLKITLEKNLEMPMLSEKAKSELLISPILIDIWEQNNKSFTIFSGVTLDVDIENGLNGECDFIITRDPKKRFSISSPIFTIVEAKNDNIPNGLPQCIAQMLGAKMFNEKENTQQVVYGCVTNGQEWQFIKLENNKALINKDLYYFDNLPTILGVLQNIINQK